MYTKIKNCLIKLYANSSLYIYSSIFHMLNLKYSDGNIRVYYDKDINKFTINLNLNILNELNEEEILFIIVHETLHIILKHLYRLENKDLNIANIAFDHVINRMLINDINTNKITNIKPPKQMILIDELMHENLTSEQVYNWIIDNLKKSDNNKIQLKNGQIIEDKPDIDFNLNKNNSDQMNMQIQLDHLGSIVKTAIEIKKNRDKQLLQRGLYTGSLEEYISQILTPKISYDKLFENIIYNSKKYISDNKSWMNYNKKLKTVLNIYLPGCDYDNSIDIILIAIDTSSSMSTTELKQSLGIINNIMEYTNELHIIYHDTKIQNIKVIKKDEFSIDDISIFKGRGGTNHTEVFDYIEKIKNQIELVIFFSDLHSNIECIYNNYTWHQFIPYWFITPIPHKLHVLPDLNKKIITITDYY